MKKNGHAQALGKLGGDARAARLSKQALRRIGQKGAKARWRKARKSLQSA